jgi:membrane fusion protein (multidrug efflux system)
MGVTTALVTQQPLTPTLRILGVVTPRPDGYAELSAPGPTRVTHVYVTVGTPVTIGTPLIAFDRAAFEATTHSAEVALTAARAAYERATRLATLGILPRKAVDQAATDLAQTNAAAVAARRTSTLALMRSPLHGVVTQMTAVQGAAVDAPTVLVAVADPSKLDVILSISPTDAATIHRGAAVVFRASDGADTTVIGRGHVSGIGVMLDSTTRTVPVHVTIDHTAHPLRIGETVTSDVTTRTIAHAVTVPQAALVPSGDRMMVFVVDHGIAHAREVTVGARADSVVQILAGLSPGQTVVAGGAFGAQDGSTIIVTPSHR